MKILIFATTFGADLWAFTHYIDKNKDVEIKILLPDPEKFKSEGVNRLFPLDAELVKRKWYHFFIGLRGFKPDVTIMDNKIPFRAPSKNGFVLWHGFGWKGPNDEEEFKWLHFFLKSAWGSAKKANKNFVWQCFGKWDFEHRTKISGFHPDNCKILGAASHDYLREPFDIEQAQQFYTFDVVNKPTVLIAPTWHYGEVFAHWGEDSKIFPKLIRQITSQGANVLLRLHDSFRFEKDYVSFLESLAEGNNDVMLKFKNDYPDNFLDMQVADVLITNYSSIANLFYATGKPTIHVYPVKNADEEFLWRSQSLTGVRKQEVDSVRFIWKLSPNEHGGFLAEKLEELQNYIDISLRDKTCCKEKAHFFLDKYMLGADGKNCERIWNALEELVNKKTDSPIEGNEVKPVAESFSRN